MTAADVVIERDDNCIVGEGIHRRFTVVYRARLNTSQGELTGVSQLDSDIPVSRHMDEHVRRVLCNVMLAKAAEPR